jgi:protocatechuate 3,4-dioxygenase beta subunit
LLLALPLLAQEPRNCAIEGTVVNASTNQPLRQVEVGVVPITERRPGSPSPGAIGVYTNADGHFRIDELAPGTYRIVINKLGYTISRGPDSKFVLPKLEPGRELKDLQFRLYPQSIVTGRVFDEYGDPVSGANVMLVRRANRGGRPPVAGATTNDQGLFYMANVNPGRYLLVSQNVESSQIFYPLPGGTLSAYVPTYCPNTADPEQAQIVQVDEGAVQTGLEIRLRREPVYTIRGRALDLEGRPMRQFHVAVSNVNGVNSYAMGSLVRTSANGQFEVRGLRPGPITLYAFSTASSNPAQSAFATVQLGNADLDNVVIQVTPPLRISGSATLEGATDTPPNWSQVAVVVSSVDPNQPANGRVPNLERDGAFELDVTGRGRARIIIAGAPAPNTYLDALLSGSEDIRNRDIDLSAGGPGPLRAVFKTGAARIQGRIDAAGATTFLNSDFVSLLKPDSPPSESRVAFAPIQPDGTFQFAGLRPGRYLLYFPSNPEDAFGGPPGDLDPAATTAIRLEPFATLEVTLKHPTRGGPQ